MSDVFDALQVLRDSDLLHDEAYRAALTGFADGDADEDDKRRIAYILWSMDNGNTCNPSDAEFDGNSLSEGRIEYLVLTDDEANEAFAERVEDSLWAFNSDFLAGETGIDARAFAALSEQCESANDAVRSMIDGTCGFDAFVESAMSADGRGHLLSSYDGNEDEITVGGSTFYFYRTN